MRNVSIGRWLAACILVGMAAVEAAAQEPVQPPAQRPVDSSDKPPEMKSGPILRWQFSRAQLAEPAADSPDTPRKVKPLYGELPAELVGPLEFPGDKPGGVLLRGSEKERQHIAVSAAADKLKLPREAISVEAWVQVDEAREWGGIVGYFQD